MPQKNNPAITILTNGTVLWFNETAGRVYSTEFDKDGRRVPLRWMYQQPGPFSPHVYGGTRRRDAVNALILAHTAEPAADPSEDKGGR